MNSSLVVHHSLKSSGRHPKQLEDLILFLALIRADCDDDEDNNVDINFQDSRKAG